MKTDTPPTTLTESDYAAADAFRALILERTGLKPSELVCPRERSDMTPCIARDGRLAVAESAGFGHPAGSKAICVGCEHSVGGLLEKEQAKHHG